MTTSNVYLDSNGDCEKAFNFYKSIFGSEFSSIVRFSDIPQNELYSTSAVSENKIKYVSLPVGNSILMGSDCDAKLPALSMQSNHLISIYADSKAEADEIYFSLVAEGKVIIPLGEAFWGEYFGILIDKFGISWMVS